MLGVSLHDLSEVEHEHLVRGVVELGVPGEQTRPREAQPLVRPHPLGLGADHEVVDSRAQKGDPELEQTDRDGGQECLPLAVFGKDREARDLDGPGRTQGGREAEILLGLERTGEAGRDPHRADRRAGRDILGQQEPGPPVVLVRHRDVVADALDVHPAPNLEGPGRRVRPFADREAVALEKVREAPVLVLRFRPRSPLCGGLHLESLLPFPQASAVPPGMA